jgi:hypothetical protein
MSILRLLLMLLLFKVITILRLELFLKRKILICLLLMRGDDNTKFKWWQRWLGGLVGWFMG